ncbi:hypothetical protein E3N88_06594 [Mikania micrantha]|uniref:Uncharacterized protein n=1 Tax=Mikania micrantha TaxID=192012 RepID=A0A5N6PP70_9ASTR|nr:hypothetical protein E3N88_06594 [Mikania micrantha]
MLIERNPRFGAFQRVNEFIAWEGLLAYRGTTVLPTVVATNVVVSMGLPIVADVEGSRNWVGKSTIAKVECVELTTQDHIWKRYAQGYVSHHEINPTMRDMWTEVESFVYPRGGSGGVKGSGSNIKAGNRKDEALICSVESAVDYWIIDYGASIHANPNRETLRNLN